MVVKGKDRKIALAVIKHKYPIGTEVFDRVRSGSFIIRKDSVFEIYSDLDEVAEPDPRYESYEILVRKRGKYSPSYQIKSSYPKRWIEAYYKERLNK